MKTNSMLPWAGIADVAEMLRLAPGDLLGGDPGLTSLRDEGIRSLEVFGGNRRVLAAAIA
jgi:hypothetical protein